MIGEALQDRANIRLTYDRGRLEIMTLSHEHERFKYLIGRLIDVVAEEAGVRIEGFGPTTYKRDVLERDVPVGANDPRQPDDLLAADGVALVWHRRRAATPRQSHLSHLVLGEQRDVTGDLPEAAR